MDELYIYRNELKNKIIPKYKIIGISSEMILSKELFKSNVDLVPFVEEVFSTSFKSAAKQNFTGSENNQIDK